MDRKKYLQKIDEVIAAGPYKADWNSLGGRTIPRWMFNGKFGIFIHWGVYSVPAFGNEWYPRSMYIKDSAEYNHHIKTYGPHSEFGYKDFIPMFTADRFNPDEWAELFALAGAKYCVPVAEHHDGFQMYKSDVSRWNAYEMGPKRDILGELKHSLNEKGIVVGASSHRIEHWFFMEHGKKFESDVKDPMNESDLYWPAKSGSYNREAGEEPVPNREFMEDWLIRCCELVDNYQPKQFYFDWWIQQEAAKPYLRKFAAYYYNSACLWGDEVTICYKHDAYPFGTATIDIERGKFAEVQPFYWQTDTAVARNSWCWTENNTFKTPKGLIQDLIDIVSKNGVLLLNIGPKSDGTISDEDKSILLKMGEWLRTNGEAVYNTHIWRKSSEGPTKTLEGQFTDSSDLQFTPQDIRFTVNGGYLYATVLEWPKDGRVTITSLAGREASNLPIFSGIIENAEVLGSSGAVWKRDGEGLHIECPQMQSDLPVVVRVTIN